MRMYDLIAKKRDGGALAEAEIAFWLRGCLAGDIPDYQTAAMLMAIYFRGMTEREIFALTDEIVRSGERLDLARISGIKADKHSTGGVGDKTTLITIPLAAAAGLKIAKMSGRSLGKTGGTADKLAAIPGFGLDMAEDELYQQVNDIGLALMTQTRNLTPADKVLYALRDMTATVDSLPLIAASVMSKKLAAGAQVIVLDVKYGSGAFMPDAASAEQLAALMVKIGRYNRRKVSAVISAMDSPLGQTVGNALEVVEAAEVLQGGGAADLRRLSLLLAGEMLYLGGIAASREDGFHRAEAELTSGRGWQKFLQMVAAQGGDTAPLQDDSLMQAKYVLKIGATESGFVTALDAAGAAELVQRLGAGRERVEDDIDPQVGIRFLKRPGDAVAVGETMAIVYANDVTVGAAVGRDLLQVVQIADVPPRAVPLVYGIVDGAEFISGDNLPV